MDRVGLKIIHIASHKGNTGDIINHEGFYKRLSRIYPIMSIDKIEMREFYFSAKNRRVYDLNFADYINSYDVCVLGGGGYFDVQWDHSCTGTTIDMSKEFVDKIKIPVIVNAMGYHEYPGTTNNDMCNKFFNFISYVSQKDNWLVTVRNDGSMGRLQYRYGKINNIFEVPDNGFFCDLNTKIINNKRDKILGLCITNDLFTKEYNQDMTTTCFNNIISQLIDNLAEHEYKFIMFPHTPADIDTINKIIKDVHVKSKRENIIVAPYDPTCLDGVVKLAKYYRRCSCVLGMRFHSLITSINLGIPAIALAGHEQIEGLFEELKLKRYCLKVDNKCTVEKLVSMINICISEKEHILKEYDLLYTWLNDRNIDYMKRISQFLK